jgi:BlaI family transcriptional regulator, penicillinase repressor
VTPPPPDPLSDAQMAFLQALWDLGEGTVADVQGHLERAGRKLAPTTVATVLRRLEAKGWVDHREEGRGFVYRASISRQRATGSLLQRLTSALGGNVPALVSHLLDTRAVSKQDIEEIKRLIEEKAGTLPEGPAAAEHRAAGSGPPGKRAPGKTTVARRAK